MKHRELIVHVCLQRALGEYFISCMFILMLYYILHVILFVIETNYHAFYLNVAFTWALCKYSGVALLQ